MTLLWVVLLGGWLAVAAERYARHRRTKHSRENQFLAESFAEAYAIKRQREAEQRAAQTSK